MLHLQPIWWFLNAEVQVAQSIHTVDRHLGHYKSIWLIKCSSSISTVVAFLPFPRTLHSALASRASSIYSVERKAAFVSSWGFKINIALLMRVLGKCNCHGHHLRDSCWGKKYMHIHKRGLMYILSNMKGIFSCFLPAFLNKWHLQMIPTMEN